MSDYITISTTTNSHDVAKNIAAKLVERQFAACVQIIGPVQSTFLWDNTVKTEDEYLCVAKSRIDLFALAESAIREIHNYEVPEIISVKINEGSAEYLKWMESVLADPSLH